MIYTWYDVFRKEVEMKLKLERDEIAIENFYHEQDKNFVFKCFETYYFPITGQVQACCIDDLFEDWELKDLISLYKKGFVGYFDNWGKLYYSFEAGAITQSFRFLESLQDFETESPILKQLLEDEDEEKELPEKPFRLVKNGKTVPILNGKAIDMANFTVKEKGDSYMLPDFNGFNIMCNCRYYEEWSLDETYNLQEYSVIGYLDSEGKLLYALDYTGSTPMGIRIFKEWTGFVNALKKAKYEEKDLRTFQTLAYDKSEDRFVITKNASDDSKEIWNLLLKGWEETQQLVAEALTPPTFDETQKQFHFDEPQPMQQAPQPMQQAPQPMQQAPMQQAPQPMQQAPQPQKNLLPFVMLMARGEGKMDKKMMMMMLMMGQTQDQNQNQGMNLLPFLLMEDGEGEDNELSEILPFLLMNGEGNGNTMNELLPLLTDMDELWAYQLPQQYLMYYIVVRKDAKKLSKFKKLLASKGLLNATELDAETALIQMAKKKE